MGIMIGPFCFRKSKTYKSWKLQYQHFHNQLWKHATPFNKFCFLQFVVKSFISWENWICNNTLWFCILKSLQNVLKSPQITPEVPKSVHLGHIFLLGLAKTVFLHCPVLHVSTRVEKNRRCASLVQTYNWSITTFSDHIAQDRSCWNGWHLGNLSKTF